MNGHVVLLEHKCIYSATNIVGIHVRFVTVQVCSQIYCGCNKQHKKSHERQETACITILSFEQNITVDTAKI